MKTHYPILDGLRGTAAIVVVIGHLLDAVFPDPANHPIHHGFLAVDFFYMLSGFVVGYAYDDRWKKMTVLDFLKTRLIRLHPLVILGIVLGAILFWFDPFNMSKANIGLLKLMGTMLIALTLLPSIDLRGYGETHSLDGPCWSLLQEYMANVMYAAFGRKLSLFWLITLVAASAVALLITAHYNGGLASGWDYPKIWIGAVRVTFSFFAGLLLFRTGRLIKIPLAYLLSSLLLVGLFILPTFKLNGLYEAGIIIFIFPMIVAAGAGSSIGERWTAICEFSGSISYPIYILHYPFVYIYTNWIHIKNPLSSHILLVAVGLFFFFLILAFVALKFYDEPIRRFLRNKYQSKS